MKKLFKRFAPLLLALVMVLGSCLTVSAADDSFVMPSSQEGFDSLIAKYKKSGFDYSIVASANVPDSRMVARIAYSTEPLDINSSNNYLVNDSARFYSVDIYKDGSSNFDSITIISLKNSYCSFFTNTYLSVLYSNYDIYRVGADKETDTPFFRGPVRPLVAAVEGAAPEEALKEVILLIPLLILYLVGYRGLQKGLQILSTLLRRA